MKVWGVSKSILSYPIPSCRVKGSIIHSHLDSTSLEIQHKKFQLILMNNGWEKKLSRPVGRSAGRPVGRPVGESQNKANSDPSAELQLGRVWAWQKLTQSFNSFWRKKLSRSGRVGRVGRVGSGRLENLRIKLTQTLSRASVRFGLSLAIVWETKVPV